MENNHTVSYQQDEDAKQCELSRHKKAADSQFMFVWHAGA
jgi:hypothetical protein